MPGVPKSRGCIRCKIRKVKCAQNWPSCTQCTKQHLDCPGPSPWVKFVPGGHQPNHREDSVKSLKSTTTGTNTPARLFWVPVYTPTNSLSSDVRIVCSKPGSTSWAGPVCSIGTPQPGISTEADRVAARLVHYIDNAPERQMITQTVRLAHLPQRLMANPSLSDSIDLLCSVWASYHSGTPRVEFINMPQYGKAIRGLARALQTDQGVSPETLAAIVILQRTEDLFNPGEAKFLHERGISALLSKMGPPKPGDDFYASVACECYSIMIPHWARTGWSRLLDDRSWTAPIVGCVTGDIGIDELEPVMLTAVDQYNHISERLPGLLQGIQIIYNPRHKENDFHTSKFFIDMTRELHDMEKWAAEIKVQAFAVVMELGAVTEREDPTSITETSYHMSSFTLFQPMISFTCLHIHFLRLYLEWSTAYSLPETHNLRKSFKSACHELWKMIPFLRANKLFLANNHRDSLALTLEFANEKEKEYLLDVFEDLVGYAKGKIKSRALLEKELVAQARLMMGGSPIK